MLHSATAASQASSLRTEAAAFQVSKRCCVGSDHAGARARLDAHVADGHAAFHGEGANGRTRVFDDAAGGAIGADLADDGEDHILGGNAAREFAFDRDAEGFGLGLRQRLGGQHMLDFAGADAEGQSSEAPCVAGVRVAADDGHAGLGEAEFRADDVNDALVGRIHVVELDAEVGAVLAQRGDLLGRDLVDDVEPAVDGGGHIVIDGGDAPVRAADLAAGQAKTFKGLRRGDLVQQLQVDVEQRWARLRARRQRAAARLFRIMFLVRYSLADSSSGPALKSAFDAGLKPVPILCTFSARRKLCPFKAPAFFEHH